MADEVYFSEVLDGVRDATPVGADLATVAITVAPAAGPAAATGAAGDPAPRAPCPGPDPFNTRVVVGCVTLDRHRRQPRRGRRDGDPAR